MEKLIESFISRYLPREDVVHRLPLSVPIAAFWPKLAAARRERAVELPLQEQNGNNFWFVLSPSIERQVDTISAAARREWLLSPFLSEQLMENAVIDEAVYSSMIEGAFTSRQQAEKLLRGSNAPANKSEQMVKNNYDALTWVLSHLEEEITADTLIQIAAILTKDASDAPVTGFREGPVYVVGREGLIYTPPESAAVPGMVDSLLAFIRQSSLHPVLKASIVHFYFVYAHPFEDGNGRTARALSLMLLLQEGFDVFRTFSISGIVAKERGRYYKAIRDVEEGEGDMTYFIDRYSDMLSRAVQGMEHQVRYHLMAQQRVEELDKLGVLNERQLKGAQWLLGQEKGQITVDAWKKKYRTATETARQDLLLLTEAGLLSRRMEGRRAIFDILR